MVRLHVVVQLCSLGLSSRRLCFSRHLYFSHRYSFLSCILRKDTTLYALPRANNSSFSSHPARCSILAVLLLTRACTSSMLREQRLHLLDMGLIMLDADMVDEDSQRLGTVLSVRYHRR